MPEITPPCVIRYQKLSSWKAVRQSARHTWRSDDVPHVDANRTHLNEDWRPVISPAGLVDALESRFACLTKKPSAKAVMCLEFLITARREAFSEHGGKTDATAYFRDALAFLEERHGAENILAVNIQNDEKAPHLVAYVVPIVERPARTVRRSVFAPGYDENGRQRRQYRHFAVLPETVLSAWNFYGTPAQMIELQTRFADQVAGHHGLARGLEMSAAAHTTNTAHQAAIARAYAEQAVVTREDLVRRRVRLRRESPAELAARLSGRVQEHYAPVVASAATAEHDRRRAREMVETARRHRARYHDEARSHRAVRNELERLTHDLTPEQHQELVSQAVSMRFENRRKEAEHKAEEYVREQAAKREREQEAAQRARQADASPEDAKASQLSGIAPEDLARLPEPERLRCWRLLRGNDGLELDFERVHGSGLFDEWGYLSDKGIALVDGGRTQQDLGHRAEPMDDPKRHAEPSSHTPTTPGL